MVAVLVAGATGWTGRAIAEGVLAADDLELVGGLSRTHAGRDLGEAWGREPLGVPVHGDVHSLIDEVDVLVDFTSAESAVGRVIETVAHGVAAVVGTSGITGSQFAKIDSVARAEGVGVIAAGNFSLTAAMAQAAALLVAPYLPHREVVDYASAGKTDAPSGTARELAELLSAIEPAPPAVPIAETSGEVAARGATVGATQVHSVRLPSFVVSTEVVFGLPDERLSIRCDAGGSPAPYVAGTLLAIRAVGSRVGLTRGLDTLLLRPTGP